MNEKQETQTFAKKSGMLWWIWSAWAFEKCKFSRGVNLIVLSFWKMYINPRSEYLQST